MILISLIQNIAILVAFSVLHQMVLRRREKGTLPYQILSGLLFGGAGVVVMATTFQFAPGIIFDSRSVILSIAGLFGGPAVAAAAAAICGAFRIWLGGPGTWVGIMVIAVSALLGVVFHYLRGKDERYMHTGWLGGFGLLVHIIVLALFLALSGGVGFEVLRRISLPILLLYPAATILVCRIFLDQEERLSAEKALLESEEKYKILAESSQTGIYIHQDDKIIYANNRFAELHGYGVEELLNMNYFDLLDPHDRERAQEIKVQRLSGGDAPQRYEVKRIRKDGKTLWCETVAVRIEYQGKPAIMGNIVDISERKLAEEQRDGFVLKLQEALSEVKTLGELLPICSHCKNIRDDKGYWNRIEAFIQERSGTEFSHSICPECAKKYYPDFKLYDD
ncbi:MAG: PAS domain S-box protein [Desulfobacterales bacterium]|nr:PAS domain S-box protein [Desulfobacterales bacterium]